MPVPRLIACDVDGTLLSLGQTQLNPSTIELIKAEQGLSLYLPSPSPVYEEDVEVYIRDESFYLKKPS